MLTYRAQLVGTRVILTEENHTSKRSFLDIESVQQHRPVVGRRIKCGLFVIGTGRRINAG